MLNKLQPSAFGDERSNNALFFKMINEIDLPEGELEQPVKTIQALTSYLMDSHIDPMHEESIIDRMHEMLSEMAIVSGFDGELEWQNDLQASSGMAISVNEAARCLLDYRRTGQFLRGIHQAILDARQKYPGETIEVLYAGCGPYAPFLTLVAPFFTPKEVQFTLIEINDESLSVAENLIQEMELGAYLRESFHADAILLKLPDPKRYHILFSETMDTALEREPIVSILLNLLPQLREGVFVLPRNVTVEGVFYREKDLSKGLDGLWDPANQDKGYSIGTVMDLEEALGTYLSMPPPPDLIFHELQLKMPPAEWRVYFALQTTVEVWEGYTLYKNESDITDLRVRKLDDLPPCEYINFEYALVDEPVLTFGVSMEEW